MNEVNLVDLQVIENVNLVNAINWTADAEIYLRTSRPVSTLIESPVKARLPRDCIRITRIRPPQGLTGLGHGRAQTSRV